MGRFAETDAEGEPDLDEVEDRLTARPTGHPPDDALTEPIEPPEQDEVS